MKKGIFIVFVLLLTLLTFLIKNIFPVTPKSNSVNFQPTTDSQNPQNKTLSSSKEPTALPQESTPVKQSFQSTQQNTLVKKESVSGFSVPILMYHYIRDYTDKNDPIGISLSVAPETFDKQMQWLSDNGFETVSLDYFLDPYKTIKKPIVITFDDGYQDAYDAAFPILKKHSFIGTFYIITGKAGTFGYLTWEEMKHMQDAGMTMGSHTISHIALSIASNETIQNELSQSKKILESYLGVKIKHFAYPFGKFNKTDERIAEETGYATAVDTKPGLNTKKTNLYTLKRIAVRDWTDFSSLPQLNTPQTKNAE